MFKILFWRKTQFILLIQFYSRYARCRVAPGPMLDFRHRPAHTIKESTWTAPTDPRLVPVQAN